MSESPSHGQLPPTRIQLGTAVPMSRTILPWSAENKEAILRSRISELEAQVENLKAQLRK